MRKYECDINSVIQDNWDRSTTLDFKKEGKKNTWCGTLMIFSSFVLQRRKNFDIL